ncbi:FUSC family protein [Streptomyces sp. NPDC086783]|uniref:FUSC family protein n=1 Tax=Streptomyces sp. NPDC086783 TaxID=3365758 RepID=UPI00382F1E9D
MPKLPSASESISAGRRAVRVTVAAAAGFYPAAHLLDRPVLAVYALFTPIAFGLLSPLPGSGRRRAGTVLRAVPAAVVLVLLGTVLAVATWSAVVGMFGVAVVLTFGATCAPRLAGIAPGLQLFYILACFPPYAPDTLPERLSGLAVGTILTVLCELFLFAETAQPPYRERIADALDLGRHAATRLVRGEATDPHMAARLRAAGRDLRLSRQPPANRPTGAGRTDRALAQAGSATRRLLDQLATLTRLAPVPADLASETLLRGIASTCADTAGILRGRRPTVGPGLIEEMIAGFLTERGTTSGNPGDSLHGLLRRQSTVLTVAVSTVTARTAAALASGVRQSTPGLPHEQFWYAEAAPVSLWWVRVRGNLTPRSVVFQNTVRTAIGLALARLVAGSLDLSHGFWVLLTVLTLGRTTAGATWSAVRSAAAGTLIGVTTAGVLLLAAGDATAVYEYLLVPMMLVAFSVGPVGGPAWAQGLFTLVVSTAFAQIAPVTWRLAEVRLIDVLTGSAVGLACGLLAWPSGARAEMRRSVAELFRTAAPVVRATTEAATGPVGPAIPRTAAAVSLRPTVHRLRIAEAAYAQYRTEPSSHTGEDGPDWLAALNYGSRVLVGAYWLPPLQGAAGLPSPLLHWAHEAATRLASATHEAADLPTGGVHVRLAPLPADVLPLASPAALSLLIDVEVWLYALATDLTAASGADGSAATHPLPPGGPLTSGAAADAR